MLHLINKDVSITTVLLCFIQHYMYVVCRAEIGFIIRTVQPTNWTWILCSGDGGVFSVLLIIYLCMYFFFCKDASQRVWSIKVEFKKS